MNPIEHVWDFIGRKINQRNPKCQNIDELRTVILQEWQQFPQERLRCLVRIMTRCVTELHNKRGGYKGNNKITELRTILQMESQNS
jgi:hypothetical protein